MQKIKNKKSPLHLLGLVSVILVISAGIFTVIKITNSNLANTPLGGNSSTINYDSPTEEEKQAGDIQKDRNIQEEEKRQDAETQIAHAIITNAGQYDNVIEVRAFIPNHYQDGTCTITFTQDRHRVTRDTPAYRDVSTTICTNPLLNRSEFPASGEWQVIVSYKSINATGQSDPQTITIN